MKVIYEYKDLVRLITKELAEKGQTLTAVQDASTSQAAAVSFRFEWADEAPRQLPAPATLEENIAKAKAYLEERAEAQAEVEPTPEEIVERRREKNREYSREYYRRGKQQADHAHAREVITQVTGSPPVHSNTETRQERTERREAVVAAKIEQEVVAPSIAPFQWSGLERPIGKASL